MKNLQLLVAVVLIAGCGASGVADDLEGCQYVGGYQRVGFRGEVNGTCEPVSVVLFDQPTPPTAGLELPKNLSVESVCVSGECHQRLGEDTVTLTGSVRLEGFSPPRSAEVELTLVRAGFEPVLIRGTVTSFEASCL